MDKIGKRHEIAFEALLKKFTPISLVSGDKQVSIELQLNDKEITKEALNALNYFYMRTPKRVMVVMMDGEKNRK